MFSEITKPQEDCTFTIIPHESGRGWKVWFTRGLTDAVFLECVTHFSTVAQMVTEGLRKLEDPDTLLTVVDPTGQWEKWLETSSYSGSHIVRLNIPTHISC